LVRVIDLSDRRLMILISGHNLTFLKTKKSDLASEDDLTGFLPIEALNKGWSLEWRLPPDKPDPVYLLDHDRQCLYEWRYIPSLGEVNEKCRELMEVAHG
jgi:hypothetical protein